MRGRWLGRTKRLDDAALRNWRRLRAADSPWEWVADLVTHHPGKVLAATLALLSIPLLALPALELDHNTLAQLPPDAESVRGVDAMRGHIASGELEPILVVIDSGGTDVWEPAALHALGVMSENLKRLDGVSSVRSVAMPTDGELPAEVEEGFADDFDQLAGGLDEAAEGARAIEDGVGELRDALAEIDQRLPGLADGLRDAAVGSGELADGVREARGGVRELRDGVAEMRQGVGEMRAGTSELRTGIATARDGAAELRDEVAEPSEAAVRRGYTALESMTTGRTDPQYETAREEFGEVYARLTGEYPPGHPQAGQQVDDDYDGLTAALDELADGLDDAVTGIEQLDAALAELDDGLGRLDAGLTELGAGLDRIVDGLDELEEGLTDATVGVDELTAGIAEMLEGVDGELLPGVTELAGGLEEGADQVDASPLELLLPGAGPAPFIVTPGLIEAAPEIRDELGFFVANDQTRTRVFIGTSAPSYSDAAMATVDEIVAVIEMSLNDSPLADARVLPTGSTAFLSEMDEVASADFRLIVVAVLIGIFVVLALLLRSLVAPLYMTVSVVFSFLVALGLVTAVFQGVLGQDGIAWYLPPFLFVLLVALGIDYSIFLMSRVREEADRRPTVAAVAFGLRSTGHVITSAGLILAGTFGALMAAPLVPLQQIGFAVAIGILLDTFVVRSFVVPSAAVLLGRWNWWPSRRARPQAERELQAPAAR